MKKPGTEVWNDEVLAGKVALEAEREDGVQVGVTESVDSILGACC